MIAAALSTNLMTFVDTLMVSQLGEAALGGVGIGGQLFFLLLALALGLTASVQAMIARRVGEQRLDLTGRVLNAGLLLAILAGLILLSVGYLATPVAVRLISGSPLVAEQVVAYLSMRLPSLLLMSLTLTFRSYWVGVNLAKWSMVSIVALSLANILFNYFLIFGNFGAPQMGVAGAGLGSTLAVLVGLFVNLGFALKLASKNGFLRGLPPKKDIRNILKVAAPESLRQMLFSLGVVALYLLIGQIGTKELAAFHVVISICLIAYIPHIGISGAATTLVGEALGRINAEDAKTWGWQVSNLGLVVLTLIGLVIVFFPLPLLGLFFVDQGTVAITVIPLQLAVFAHVLDGYSKVLAGALVGAGATRIAMQLTLFPQYLILLPILAISVFVGFGLSVAMTIFLGASAITAMLFASAWHREKWNGIKL